MSIVEKDGAFYVADEGSTYGTSVNGKQLVAQQQALIRENDLISIGASTFRFHFL